MMGTAMSSLWARSSEACPPRLKMPTLYPVLPRLRVGMASRCGDSLMAAVAAAAGTFGSAAEPITAAVIRPLDLRNARRLLRGDMPGLLLMVCLHCRWKSNINCYAVPVRASMPGRTSTRRNFVERLLRRVRHVFVDLSAQTFELVLLKRLGISARKDRNRGLNVFTGSCVIALANGDVRVGEVNVGGPVGHARQLGQGLAVDVVEKLCRVVESLEFDEASGERIRCRTSQPGALSEGLARSVVSTACAGQTVGGVSSAALHQRKIRKGCDREERRWPLLLYGDPVKFEAVTCGVVETFESTFALRACAEHLHGEFVVGAKLGDECGIDGVRLVHSLSVFVLDHECLGEIQTHAQHLRRIGTTRAGIGLNQIAEDAFGLGAIAQSNVREAQTLLESQPRVLINRRHVDRFVGRGLKVIFRRLRVVADERDHAAGGIEPYRKIVANLRQFGNFGFLCRENRLSDVERTRLIAARLESRALKLGDDGVLR